MTVPNVYNSTSRVTSWDGAGIYDALAAEIAANGAANQITITDSTATGMLVRFAQIDTDLGRSVRFSIRQGSTTDFISVGVAGDGVIDGAGALATAPTGTGADWSGEKQYDWTTGAPGAGSKMWTIMLDDAIIVLVTDPTNSFHESAFYFGSVYVPTTGADDVANGRDGLGFLMGVPQGLEPNNFDRWLSTGSAANGLLHHFDGSWCEPGVLGNTPMDAFDVTPPGVGVYAPPPGAPITAYYDGRHRLIGVTKHLAVVSSAQPPLTVVPHPTTNQGWIHFFNAVSNEAFVAIWDKTVTP